MNLELVGINKIFNKTVAVDNLHLRIRKGTVLGLVGPNGAGKTTTIRMIMNILQPDSGKILFNGEKFRPELYRKIGYLPEERGLYRKVKLLDLIIYFGTLKGLSLINARKSAVRYLERFEMEHYDNRKIEELSKGNQQKVQFIIAVLHNPELIILDEPFSGLDPVNQTILKEIIREFQADGKTVIFSTHQMEQVEKLCQEVCMINNGKSVLNGPLKEIKRNYGSRRFTIHYKGNRQTVQDRLDSSFIINDKTIEGTLITGLEINNVLQEIIGHVTITHVDISDVSLEQIFIDQVKGKKDV
ncbi:MAG: ATP-binding cassette domain-containing protein [Candidatus Marinimicrobia bacterium]|nr:ATP-binding cassette domain-containing protein [Candidatus Neomarinimicrobiota bacterium]